MNYIIIPSSETQSSEERTRALSRELYRLSRPVPNPGDVTEYLFGFQSHPVTGKVAMECDAAAVIPVSTQADPSGIVALLDPSPEQEQEVAGLVALVESRKGQTLAFGEITPSWVVARTREELEADGWFPEPDEQ